MKKIILLGFILSLLYTDLSSQVNFSNSIDENRLVYWFQIRIREVEDDSTGYVSFIIPEVKRKLLHGSESEYRKNLYQSLDNNIINIGPFNDFDQAWRSKVIYEHLAFDPKKEILYGDNSFLVDSVYDDNIQVFWFIQSLVWDKKNRLELIRKPGAIASGAYRDFYLFTSENLMMRTLTVGPFLYMPEAEESKRIYRIKKREYNRRRFFSALNIFKK
ncbi:MAG: hypothetical protein K8R54_12115 [Bacteroidales bacterium]|nr:hypothetical protein [Bacteroidales bacterium]